MKKSDIIMTNHNELNLKYDRFVTIITGNFIMVFHDDLYIYLYIFLSI